MRARRIGCLIVESALDGEQLWEGLTMLSPAVEPDAPGRFYLDAGGVTPRYDSESDWARTVLAETATAGSVQMRLGVAGSKFAAEMAAEAASPDVGFLSVSEPDARFLAPLAAEKLPLSREAIRRLRVLGLRTIGQLAALPQAAVAEQFGPESLVAWRWARGQDERPVIGQRCQTVWASQMFATPEARGEALLTTAVRLAERALNDLPVSRHAWAIRQVGLVALTDAGQQLVDDNWFGDTPGTEALCGALERLLRRWQGSASSGLTELTVWLWGFEPAHARQLSLLENQESDLRWRQVVAALQRRYPEQLLQPVLADAAAPIMTERHALRAWS